MTQIERGAHKDFTHIGVTHSPRRTGRHAQRRASDEPTNDPAYVPPEVIEAAAKRDVYRTAEDREGTSQILAWRGESVGDGAVKTKTAVEKAAEAQERRELNAGIRERLGITPV